MTSREATATLAERVIAATDGIEGTLFCFAGYRRALISALREGFPLLDPFEVDAEIGAYIRHLGVDVLMVEPSPADVANGGDFLKRWQERLAVHICSTFHAPGDPDT